MSLSLARRDSDMEKSRSIAAKYAWQNRLVTQSPPAFVANIESEVADTFQNPHESPQLMLIRDGICTYDAEGFDITVEELHECYEDSF